ncbi:hypothetical protein GCM10009788_11280 [Nocardioides humi]|uniref:Uncharacterized protein n=1 Tax=Nocardioides humi TaxID=449461 RepID=A0ABN2A0I0_9ACTN
MTEEPNRKFGERSPKEMDRLAGLFVERIRSLVRQGVTRVPEDLDYDIDTLSICDPRLRVAIRARLASDPGEAIHFFVSAASFSPNSRCQTSPHGFSKPPTQREPARG